MFVVDIQQETQENQESIHIHDLLGNSETKHLFNYLNITEDTNIQFNNTYYMVLYNKNTIKYYDFIKRKIHRIYTLQKSGLHKFKLNNTYKFIIIQLG